MEFRAERSLGDIGLDVQMVAVVVALAVAVKKTMACHVYLLVVNSHC